MAPRRYDRSMSESGGQRPSRRQPSPKGGDYDVYLVRMRRVWRPPTDVYETDDHIIVQVEIAGIDREDLDIALDGRQLTVSGDRKNPKGKRSYQNMEIHYGEFRTEVRIDRPFDDSGIEAEYTDGFLYVRIPKAEQRRIQVSSSDENE